MARGWNQRGPRASRTGTRAKIELLMQPIMSDPFALAAVIGKIAQKRPEDVLDAVIAVVSDEPAAEKR